MAERKVVPVRLDDAIRARVEAHRKRLRQTTGVEHTQSQVVRMLVERGLEAVEAEAHPRKKK